MLSNGSHNSSVPVPNAVVRLCPVVPGSPAGPGGPAVPSGTSVTLTSLLPSTTVTLTVCDVQPGPGLCTVTVYGPFARLMVAGVTLPVLMPLTTTCIPRVL